MSQDLRGSNGRQCNLTNYGALTRYPIAAQYP